MARVDLKAAELQRGNDPIGGAKQIAGTPTAHNFDYWVRVGGKYVCPMNVLPEPSRTTLMNLLGPGPKSGKQADVPGTGVNDVPGQEKVRP